MTIKCISIMQPWATLIILGAECREVRSWSTRHRGLLAVHASKQVCREAFQLCREEPFRTLLRRSGYASDFDFPSGALLGTVRLVSCRRAGSSEPRNLEETGLGRCRRRRWIWEFADAKPLPAPIPMSGRVGIYEIPSWYLVLGSQEEVGDLA